MTKLFNEIKQNLYKNRITLLLFLAVWVALIIFTNNMYKTTMGMESVGNKSSEHVCEVYQGRTVIQSFPTVEGVNGISIKFATYARKNEGNVTIKVLGSESGKEYASEIVNISDIQDNSFLTIGLNDEVTDDLLLINISSDSIMNKSVGVYYSATDNIKGGTFSVNGFSPTGDLTCKQLKENEYYQRFSKAVIIWTVLGFSLIILLILIEVKEEILYSSMVLIIGLVFMAIMTPMSVPDEQFHYESAYQITSKILGEDHRYMDTAYRNYSHFGGHENVSSAYKRFVEHINDPLELDYEYEKVTTDIDELTYIVYFFPQTVGVFLGRVCKLNFLKTFYFGRFTNLLFFVSCVFFAIKTTPVHKTLFGILCCTPMFIQQCSSYSYDGFVNGLCIIVICFFMKWFHKEEKINNKELLIVFLATLGLAPAKIVYGMFIVPFIFIPKEKFGGTRNKLISLLLLCAPVAFILVRTLMPQIERIFNRISETYGESQTEPEVKSAGFNLPFRFRFDDDVDPSELEERLFSIGFIVEHPIYTAKLILRTVRFSIKKWFYDSLGRTLSGVSLILPLNQIHMLSLVILLAAFIKEDYLLPVIVKIVILAVCVIIAFMILLGFLLSWTNRSDTMIMGVQGRYFSPLLPYFFSTFNNRFVFIPKQSGKYLTFAHLLLMFEVIMYILSFTFVN